MKNSQLLYCQSCAESLSTGSQEAVCSGCGKKYQVVDGVPVFAKDIYWGKVPESELKRIIDDIEHNGFNTLTPSLQKKIDFTFDEDRADWRFFMSIPKEAVVLDVGAGLGRISIPLARAYAQVIACDQSLSRMRFLKLRAEHEGLKNITTFVGDIFDLPLKENSVDLIVMNGVLEWVGLTDLYKDPHDAQIKCLEICRRLLKKGGYLYVGIENRFAAAYLRAADHGGLRYTSFMPRPMANLYSKLMKRKPYRTYTYTKRGYEQLLTKAGFTERPSFYILYPGYNLPRLAIPYENLGAFSYAALAFRPRNGLLRRAISLLTRSAFFSRLYNFFSYSFGIMIRK